MTKTLDVLLLVIFGTIFVVSTCTWIAFGDNVSNVISCGAVVSFAAAVFVVVVGLVAKK